MARYTPSGPVLAPRAYMSTNEILSLSYKRQEKFSSSLTKRTPAAAKWVARCECSRVPPLHGDAYDARLDHFDALNVKENVRKGVYQTNKAVGKNLDGQPRSFVEPDGSLFESVRGDTIFVGEVFVDGGKELVIGIACR